ncbi:MAG: amino acid--tRNA ligase-related protein, partial [Gammaproteobacteria bacterium]
YRQGISLERMSAECCEYILALCQYGTVKPADEQRLDYCNLLRDTINYDPLQPDAEQLTDIAKTLLGESMPELDSNADDTATLLDLLLSHVVIPSLDPNVLSVISAYPADQAQLARTNPDDPRLAERFEIFFQGMELANGYRELVDRQEQEQRFEADQRRRALTNRAHIQGDPALLAALTNGLPDCCGVAVGLDRVLMCCTGSTHIGETLSFMPGR